MNRWISLYWVWLLPGLTTLVTLHRLRRLHLAYRRELVAASSARWLLAGLIAAQTLIWIFQLALVYQTNLWLSVSSIGLIGVMLISARVARAGTHPGLWGLQRRLPQDGLELLRLERQSSRERLLSTDTLFNWSPLIPAWSVIGLVAWAQPERWIEFAVCGCAAAAPVLVAPHKRRWLAPLFLLFPVMFVFVQSLSLSARLPPGRWETPITGARCRGQIRIQGRAAWCANAGMATVYKFDARSGVVDLEIRIEEAARVFAANAERAWVQQSPARGLILVDAATAASTPIRVLSAHSGAADPANRLWVIDVGDELSVYVEDEVNQLRSRDGLLNNTAAAVRISPGGDVWVGSLGGLSWLPAGETYWVTADQGAGLPGAIRNFAFEAAPEAGVWLIWQGRGLQAWGVIRLGEDGSLSNLIDIGNLMHLEFPLAEDAIAVDVYGRVWFVTQSIPAREKYLGIYTPGVDPPVELYSLGMFPTSGPYIYGGGLWKSSYGVVSDGEGGILLFNDVSTPWRRWRP